MKLNGKIFFLPFLLLSICLGQAYAYNIRYTTNDNNIYKGYISEKIWLKDFLMPEVSISDINYTNNIDLPKDATTSKTSKIEVALGMEKKRPFAIVRIPVFMEGQEKGKVNKVHEFTLDIKEQPAENKNKTSGTSFSDVPNSVLASGKWYKIGITQTGFYKFDYNFITSLGVDPSKIDPTMIRVYGNGGNMLSEDNKVFRQTDLLENAIYVNAPGSTFTTGSYVIFYGVGPTAWYKDSLNKMFHHRTNLYTDTAYYFISFDRPGQGARVTLQPSVPAGNTIVNSYNYYEAHEQDLLNPAGFGKNWYGEQFNPLLGNLSQSFSFQPGSYIDTAYCLLSYANVEQTGGSSVTMSLNGNQCGTSYYGAPTTGDIIMNLSTIGGRFPCKSQNINFQITFNPSDATGVGYLDYIEVNARRQLSMVSDQLNFRDWNSVGAGNIATYQLQGANSSTMVWDITNPQQPLMMNGTLSGSTYSFSQDAAILHEFAAINSQNLFTPVYVGQVANQDLHGLPQVDCIIVTAPDFLDQANKLADFHRTHDKLKVAVATTSQIYNEFSSGGQDICSIRDFERMFYKRAGTDTTKMPRYLILFGGASYDYKNRLPNNSNYVPVFESAESLSDLLSFSSDDFYGFLDDFECIENNTLLNVLDIAVGRLPARTTDDATNLINKITNYAGPSALGPWRLSATIVADNNDQAGNHMDDAEFMGQTINTCSSDLYNERKVYIDALNVTSTPAGPRCPDANAGINDQIFKGTFMVNYNGHGNTQVWASERILTQDDYNNWQNANMLPFMITATCDFGQFDHPQYTSAAEQLVTRNGGGVIAMLTTTQAVYAVYNHYINSQYLTAQFTRNPNGKWNTFGDAALTGKNITFAVVKDQQEIANFRKFALLGDPALTPDFPQYTIKIDSIIDPATKNPSDTIKALGAYLIKGSVLDENQNLNTAFSGDLTVSIYDKPRKITTISGTNETFYMQDNVIYKGKATITNGMFSFSFIAPKDINYFYGNGKISLYAQNSVTDAAGIDSSFAVGGYSESPVTNSAPPIVKPYINDSLFHDGGITGTNTSLFIILNDFTGINVSGNLVGHDLKAVLDGNIEQPYILNDFYETAPNTYQTGYVTYPLTGLADGKHKIVVTAWDVNDNTGDGEVNFTVVNGRVVDIQSLGNYPNPFNGLTHFVFEHNHPMEQLKAQIEIYNTSGALVKKIEDTFTPEGSWSNDITWDGTDDNGARLPSGMYVYRLNVTSDRGFVSSAYQKLVIVR